MGAMMSISSELPPEYSIFTLHKGKERGINTAKKLLSGVSDDCYLTL